jgi:hypothetical protein
MVTKTTSAGHTPAASSEKPCFMMTKMTVSSGGLDQGTTKAKKGSYVRNCIFLHEGKKNSQVTAGLNL